MDRKRRKFIQGVGAGAATILLPACGIDSPRPEPEPPLPQPTPEPTPDPTPEPIPEPTPEPTPVPAPELRIRSEINSLAADDRNLQTYRAAVTAMQALPASDPRSWQAQATIHLEHCPHGNWYFLPWHRAYLHRFEEICRELTGNDDFALPYWNWTENPRLPAAVWGNNNPLFHANRFATQQSTARPEMVGPDIINEVLAETNFELFASQPAAGQRDISEYGLLEGSPHNHIHGLVGGDMQTFMSPLDPVFWMHHANIDRIWARWNFAGNPNTGSVRWRNFIFADNFVDRNGNPVNIRISETEDLRELGYTYDDVPSFTPTDFSATFRPPERDPVSYSTTNLKPAAVNRPLTVSVRKDDELIREATQPDTLGLARPRRVFAVIGDIDAPKNEQIIVRVFLNYSGLSSSTPVDDPHYAGSFAFFASEHAMHGGSHHKPTFSIGITDTIKRLEAAGELTGSDIQVQLIPIPLTGRETAGTDFVARRVAVKFR